MSGDVIDRCHLIAVQCRYGGVDVPRARDHHVTAAPAAEAARIAFTLRLTPDQADELDTLVLRLRRQLGRGRLDKADVLLALVQAANVSDDVRAAALGQLRR